MHVSRQRRAIRRAVEIVAMKANFLEIGTSHYLEYFHFCA